MPPSADTHGDTVQDGHVRLVLVQTLQPVGQFMFGEVQFERFLLRVFL